MLHVCQLLGPSTTWEQRVGVSQLIARLPRDKFATVLAATDQVTRLAFSGMRSVELVGRAGTSNLLAPAMFAAGLARWLSRRRIDFLHTWSVAGAFAGWLGLRGGRNARTRLVLELFDPGIPRRQIKLLRIIHALQPFPIICGSQTTRRRLMECGLPPDSCAVIRPGVDFAKITQWRSGPVRQALGLQAGEQAVVIPEPRCRRHAFWEACWAVELLQRVSGRFRLLLAGGFRESRRIARFLRGLPGEGGAVLPDTRVRFEELLAVADVLLVPSRGDLSTTCVAWAMAAGAVVIGSADYAVAELIAHKVNGLLFKRPPGNGTVVSIAELVHHSDAHQKIREVARAQAYEVFGIRRFVDQHVRVYENLLHGKPAAEGVIDSASL